ncbi:hypothetical protein SAMN02982994_3672 [Azospirillum lipoferum]|nr:hypothetical protein SAMN02982994_3672 [Azospirillum lipoferum]
MDLILLGGAMAAVLAGVIATLPTPKPVPVRIRDRRRQRR